MVRLSESQGDRLWLTSLPNELSYLIPSPTGLRYEYAISALQASEGSGLSATLVIRARGTNPAERFVINPTRLSEEIIACGGGDYDRQEGSKSQLRFNEDGAFRLEDVSYRCAHFHTGCPSTLRVRHWAPASGSTAPKADNRPQRRCVECGRKGHRKQCCCDEPGNCRVEIVWAHTHALDATPPLNASRKRANSRFCADGSMHASGPIKKSRLDAKSGNESCLCFILQENIRDGRKKLTSAQTALRTLKRTIRQIDEANSLLEKDLSKPPSGDVQDEIRRNQYREELRQEVEQLCADRNRPTDSSGGDQEDMMMTSADGEQSKNMLQEKEGEMASTRIVDAQIKNVEAKLS